MYRAVKTQTPNEMLLWQDCKQIHQYMFYTLTQQSLFYYKTSHSGWFSQTWVIWLCHLCRFMVSAEWDVKIVTRQFHCSSYTKPEVKEMWYFSLQPTLNINHHHNLRQHWSMEYEAAWSVLKLNGNWNMDIKSSDLLCVHAATQSCTVSQTFSCWHQTKWLITQRSEFHLRHFIQSNSCW